MSEGRRMLRGLFGRLRGGSSGNLPARMRSASPVLVNTDDKEYSWREMEDDRRRVLNLLESGKITAAEADQLLRAMETPESAETVVRKSRPKYLRIVVSDGGDNVNLKIPLGVLSSGLKIATFIPGPAREKIREHLGRHGADVDLDNLTPKTLYELIEDLNIEVGDRKGSTVRIFCE